MPCNSDHCEATALEIKCSQLYLLLDELETGKHVDSDTSDWRGYDKRAYNHSTRELADELTDKLCTKLKEEVDFSDFTFKRFTDYSLELQIWWRDHKKLDETREMGKSIRELGNIN